jgi:hypothetical protein
VIDAGLASVIAMLIQMSLEKYAKAAALRSGGQYEQISRSHTAIALLWTSVSRTERSLPKAFNRAKNLLRQLEALHPGHARNHANGDGVFPNGQLEYPWQDVDGNIRYPAQDLPLARVWANPGDRGLAVLLGFADYLDANFDNFFG